MDQAEAPALRHEVDHRQQRAEIRLLRRRDLTGPEEGLVTTSFIPGIVIGAAAVFAVEADTFVVVAHARWDPALTDQHDRLVRSGAIAGQFADAGDGIGDPSLDGRTTSVAATVQRARCKTRRAWHHPGHEAPNPLHDCQAAGVWGKLFLTVVPRSSEPEELRVQRGSSP